MQQTLRNRRYLRHRKIHKIEVICSRLHSTIRSSLLLELSLTLFDTRPTSNVVRIHNTRHVSVCPPTPSMISYRQKSLPTLVPTRIINYPKPFNESMKQLDVDHLDI